MLVLVLVVGGLLVPRHGRGVVGPAALVVSSRAPCCRRRPGKEGAQKASPLACRDAGAGVLGCLSDRQPGGGAERRHDGMTRAAAAAGAVCRRAAREAERFNSSLRAFVPR